MVTTIQIPPTRSVAASIPWPAAGSCAIVPPSPAVAWRTPAPPKYIMVLDNGSKRNVENLEAELPAEWRRQLAEDAPLVLDARCFECGMRIARTSQNTRRARSQRRNLRCRGDCKVV